MGAKPAPGPGLMPSELPPICLLAGGLGRRLGETVRDAPKPLLNVAGEPFLIHQLRLLALHGAVRVVLCVGYLGELIEERIGSSQFGIDITYSYDGPSPIGTLGAVRKAATLLDERFLVLYGDTYLRLDYRAVVAAWEASGLPALMTVLRNEGQWDVSNVCFDGTRVTKYDKRAPVPEMRWIDFGLGGLQADALELLADTADDLADLYHDLAERGELFGFAATERFFEIGTPASLAETGEFLAGIVGQGETRRVP
jgi:NDP-sugar pyrophosphorylase family protein